MASQYAYSNISIISGIFGLAVTIFINIMSSFISLSSLHFDRMPTSIVWFSQMLNPALWSYRAALMVDHDNTNPIKAIYLEWFSDRLQLIRKAEVSIRSCCFQALLVLCIGEKYFLLGILFFPRIFIFSPDQSNSIVIPHLVLMNTLQELACSSEQTSFGDDCSGERKSKSIRQERIRNRFGSFVCCPIILEDAPPSCDATEILFWTVECVGKSLVNTTFRFQVSSVGVDVSESLIDQISQKSHTSDIRI